MSIECGTDGSGDPGVLVQLAAEGPSSAFTAWNWRVVGQEVLVEGAQSLGGPVALLLLVLPTNTLV